MCVHSTDKFAKCTKLIVASLNEPHSYVESGVVVHAQRNTWDCNTLCSIGMGIFLGSLLTWKFFM